MANPPTEQGIKEKETDESSPKKKKRKKGLILMAGILLIMGGFSSVYFLMPGLLPFFHRSKETGETSKVVKKEHPKTQGHLYDMESIIVNLADVDIPRYLKIRIEFESEELKANEEFDQRLPQLKDAIITILSSKTYQEIYEIEGKIKLKEAMIEKANQLFKSFKIKSVYFTEFVIQ